MRATIAALVFCAVLRVPALAALAVPEGGLPAGRVAVEPLIKAPAATIGTWGIVRDYMKTGGSELPGAAEIASLDPEAGRYAAGALLNNVPPQLWADLMLRKDVDPAERARMLSAFEAAQKKTDAALTQSNAGLLSRLQVELLAGRVGLGDLEQLSTVLRGLGARSPALKAMQAEVAATVESQKSRQIADGVAAGAATWDEKKDPGLAVAGAESAGAPRLERAAPKAKNDHGWIPKVAGMTAAVVAADAGTKFMAAKFLFTMFHDAAWRAPLMAFIVPFIFVTAYKARAPLMRDRSVWRWSAKRLGNGRVGFYKEPLAGVQSMLERHPSLKPLLRIYDVSIALMLGGMLGNGVDLLRLGGALDWIPLGRSLMNFADIALISGLAVFQLATHFFIRAGESEASGKPLKWSTVSFLGMPIAGFFAAWAFGSAAGHEALDLAMKNIGYIYLMGFSMLIGISRFMAAGILQRFVNRFTDEQAKKA